jgi:hypothetical protein
MGQHAICVPPHLRGLPLRPDTHTAAQWRQSWRRTSAAPSSAHRIDGKPPYLPAVMPSVSVRRSIHAKYGAQHSFRGTHLRLRESGVRSARRAPHTDEQLRHSVPTQFQRCLHTGARTLRRCVSVHSYCSRTRNRPASSPTPAPRGEGIHVWCVRCHRPRTRATASQLRRRHLLG